jgi:hypothetical protein
MQLKIKVTKEHIEKAKNCEGFGEYQQNCAIALAVRDIFPDAHVELGMFFVKADFFKDWLKVLTRSTLMRFEKEHTIRLPEKAQDFISKFDNSSPEERCQLPELEFEVDIPDHILEEHINIEEIKEILNGHPTLTII